MDVVDQPPVFVHDIDPVDGLGVAAVGADVLERPGHGPVGEDADVVRRHQATDALGRVPEDLLGFAPRLGAERGDEPSGDLVGHLVQQGRPVVRVHGLDDPGGGASQRLDEVFLCVEFELSQGFAGQIPWQEPKRGRRVV